MLNEAQTKLVNDNLYLVKYVMRKHYHSYSPNSQFYEDYIQSGYLGLCEAASRFVDDGEREFINYAYTYILGHIINCMKTVNGFNMSYRSDGSMKLKQEPIAALDKVEFVDSFGKELTLCDILPNKQAEIDMDTAVLIQDLKKAFRSNKTRNGYFYLQAKMAGLTMQEIADIVGVSKQSVGQFFLNAKKRYLKENGEDSIWQTQC